MTGPAATEMETGAAPATSALFPTDAELDAQIVFIFATARAQLGRTGEERARWIAAIHAMASGLFITRMPCADLARFLERICLPEPGRC